MSEGGSIDPRAGAAPVGDWQSLARGASSQRRGEPLAGDGAALLLRELLVFGLEGTAYAVPVERVREIVRMKPLTRIPRVPAWILGVVTLRGEVVEVVDLRRRLGLGASNPDRTHRIIVLHGDSDRVTGMLVDSVSEVYRVPDEDVLPAQGLDVNAVEEICRRGDAFVSILDVDRAVGVADG